MDPKEQQDTLIEMNSTDIANVTIGDGLDNEQIGMATVIGVLCLLLVLASVIICILSGTIYMAKSMMKQRRSLRDERNESLMSNPAYISNRGNLSVKSTTTNRQNTCTEERNESLISNAAYIPNRQTEVSTTVSEEPFYSEVRQQILNIVPRPSLIRGYSVSCSPIGVMPNEACKPAHVLGDKFGSASASLGSSGNDIDFERPQDWHTRSL